MRIYKVNANIQEKIELTIIYQWFFPNLGTQNEILNRINDARGKQLE